MIAHWLPTYLKISGVITALNNIYKAMGLVINTDKTGVLFQWYGPDPPNSQVICFGETNLKSTSQFCYLGSVLSSDSSMNADINSRIG